MFIAAVVLSAAFIAAGAAVMYFYYVYTAESARGVRQTRVITTDDLRTRFGDEVRIDFVYSPSDEWGRETADYLAGRMEGYDYVIPTVCADFEYSAEERRNGFAVFLGHTVCSNESYLEAFMRIGEDGLEISREADENGDTESVTVLAFRRETAMEGAERFADFFLSVNRIRNVLTKLYITKISGERLGFISLSEKERGARETTLVVSAPDSGSYTEKLLSAMVQRCAPSAIVVNGGMAGSDSREEIAAVCSVINQSRGAADWGYRLITTDPSGSRLDLALEVIKASGSDRNEFSKTEFILYADAAKVPLGICVFAGIDDLDDPSTTAERMRILRRVAERAGTSDVPFAVYLPALPEACTLTGGFSVTGFDPESGLNLLGNWASCTDARADGLYESALECGAGLLVCHAGFCNVGTLPAADGSDAVLALCGAVGFTNPGVGGKFRLNNSLRGGIAVTFEYGASVTAEPLVAAGFPEVFEDG